MRLRQRLQSALLLALVTPACGGQQTVTIGDDAGGGTDGPGQADAVGPEDVGTGPDVQPRDVNVGDVSCSHTGTLPSANACFEYVWPPCGYSGGPLSPAECSALCPTRDSGATAFSCYVAKENGEQFVSCSYCGVTGRRHEGIPDAPGMGDTPASFFARCAWLEAASVHAFRRLARELAAHEAPVHLVARCRRAAREEVRHTAVTGRLARHFGGTVTLPDVPRGTIRPLVDVAWENAVEGCVRETYGALLAMWQAAKASDPGARRALRTIARDEASHAELSWQIMAWIERKLDVESRGRVEEARRAAIDVLRAELRREPPRDLVAIVGLPTAKEALGLLDAAIARHVFAFSRAA